MTASPTSTGNPVALVTGGSRGIGRAVVEALAENGYRVHFSSRNPDSRQRAEEELSSRFGDRVAGATVDVRRQEEVDAWVGRVHEAEGRIDCLVNNAGLGVFVPITELTGEQWRNVIETNLSGAFYPLRAVAPIMVGQESGWIFNIASLAGRHAFAGGSAYNASKFGMIGMSEAAMLDLRRFGVRVTALLPGSVDTDFQSSEGSDWKMQPEDVAQMILDLLRFPNRTLPSLVEMRPTRTAPRS